MAEHGEPWLPHSRAVQTPQECGGKQDSWTVYILVFCNYNCMFFSVQQNTKAKSYLSCLIHYSEKIRGRPDHHHMSVKKITLSELLMSISEHTAKIGLHQDCMWSWYSLAASMVTAQHRAAWLAFPRDQQNSYWCPFSLCRREQVISEHTWQAWKSLEGCGTLYAVQWFPHS